MKELRQKARVVVFLLNVGLASLLFYKINDNLTIFGTGTGVWLLTAVTYWLLTLITTPFFQPPKDSLATAISIILLLAPLNFPSAITSREALELINFSTIVLGAVVVGLALIAIFYQSEGQRSLLGDVSYKLSQRIGKSEVLFTPAILVAVYGFYQDSLENILLISAFWVLMVIAKPVDLLARIILYIWSARDELSQSSESVGSILRIDNPNILRVSLTNNALTWNSRETHVAHLANDTRAYVLPLFAQVQGEEVIGTGLYIDMGQKAPFKTIEGRVYKCAEANIDKKLMENLSGVSGKISMAGVTAERSRISGIKFQAIPNIELEEGMLVFANMRGKRIYYQILDATTAEESFRENPFGMHLVSAIQLGAYSPESGFKKFPWLPPMNHPLFLVPKDELQKQVLDENEFIIGNIPNTKFGVRVVLSDLIEYHAAVLGVTGTGKTELVFDIVKNALVRDAKVFCVDFTGEYRHRLSSYSPEIIGLSLEQIGKLEACLFAVETGTYGATAEKAALQKFVDEIKPEIAAQIKDFVENKNKKLGIFELPEITNTKATLRITEMYLSAIMDWARKHRKAQQMLIVLEEAHTIIPEVYSSGFDQDTQWVVGRIGQIALQGRKYGVGLLIVSQRTALVSKTILSQCNTYFTHSLVDKTSLDYLSGVYSSEHVQAIPNLQPYEFLAHGKSIKSERPLLARVDFDIDKLNASKELDKKPGKQDATTTTSLQSDSDSMQDPSGSEAKEISLEDIQF